MEKEHRQMILLIGFMAILTGVFIFLINYAPESLEINPEVNTSGYRSDLPGPVNESIHGLEKIYEDVRNSMDGSLASEFSTG